MEKTAIQVGISPLAPPVSLPALRPKQFPLAWKVLQTLASLRITVVLFALSIFLVFCGTLAQVDAGVWTVVNRYFRSAFVLVPLQIFFPRTITVAGGFPFPGGWLLGGLLLINLLAAHALRFKISWRRSGILLIHSGLIVMMVSELITGLFAIESKMVLATGETAGFLDASREVELAFIDSSKPKIDDVVVIPESLLRKGGVIHDDLLPVDVEVVEYMDNSTLKAIDGPGEAIKDAKIAGNGHYYVLAPHSEGAGVEANQPEDAVAVRVIFRKKGSSEKLGEGLYSLWYYPNFTLRQLRFGKQQVVVEGKPYRVELRFKRIQTPYSIQLLEFRHDVYLGTDKPKNFSSRVRVLDPERKDDREVTISMNAPLRYAGETFYQTGFLPGDRGTVLQVVRNPGWLMPYISCAMVALGMIIHFGLHLVKFLERRMAA
jgi:ResB-like family